MRPDISRAITGPDLILNVYRSGRRPPDELLKLMALTDTFRRDRHAIFYVKDIDDPAIAATVNSIGSSMAPSVMTNRVKPRSLAHEIGHKLLTFRDLDAHEVPLDNIMRPSASATAENLLYAGQCTRMRKHPVLRTYIYDPSSRHPEI